MKPYRRRDGVSSLFLEKAHFRPKADIWSVKGPGRLSGWVCRQTKSSTQRVMRQRMSNQYGLSRHIPADVKRAVRQRCRFGCVVCGLGVYDYEHVDPEFKDAREHDSHRIALLCPSCHAKVTRGQWSKERIKAALKNPKAAEAGYAKEFFDFTGGHPEVIFGGNTLRNCSVPVMVHGIPLISITPSAEPGAPFELSANFSDQFGSPTLSIEKNEWRVWSDNWDVEVRGPAITIVSRNRESALCLRALPPNALAVERLEMSLGAYRFTCTPDRLIIRTQTGGIMDFSRNIMDGCTVGLALG